MSQNECACDKPVIEIPVRGLKLQLEPNLYTKNTDPVIA